MARITRTARLRAARWVSFTSTSLLALLWSTAAYAQSREDQYGSPTGPVDHVGQVSDTLSVLPETGGPLVLFVGGALIVAGTSLALLRRRASHR